MDAHAWPHTRRANAARHGRSEGVLGRWVSGLVVLAALLVGCGGQTQSPLPTPTPLPWYATTAKSGTLGSAGEGAAVTGGAGVAVVTGG